MKVFTQDKSRVLNSSYIADMFVRKNNRTNGYEIVADREDTFIPVGEYLTEEDCIAVLTQYFDCDTDFAFPSAEDAGLRNNVLSVLRPISFFTLKPCLETCVYDILNRERNARNIKLDTIGDFLDLDTDSLLKLDKIGVNTAGEIGYLQLSIRSAPEWWKNNISCPERFFTEEGRAELDAEMGFPES